MGRILSVLSAGNEPVARRGLSEQGRRGLRAVGLFLLLLAAAALSFDVFIMITGYGPTGFSGIKDIWDNFDKGGFNAVEGVITGTLGSTVWIYAVKPVMTLPLAVEFGLPGLLLVRRFSREIEARKPSPQQIEMQRMGVDPRSRIQRRY